MPQDPDDTSGGDTTKKCPYCGKEYPDGTAVCPIDRNVLTTVTRKAKQMGQPSMPSPSAGNAAAAPAVTLANSLPMVTRQPPCVPRSSERVLDADVKKALDLRLARGEISPQEYEKTLLWIAEKEREGALELKATCAPHYYRILKQKGIPPRNPGGQGCLGGKSYAFISARGEVQICGYLPLPAGDLRKNDFDFPAIWAGSELFRAVREVDSYQGKCGSCEYNKICGGCRARAFAFGGNYLGEEPFCLYKPKPVTGSRRL